MRHFLIALGIIATVVSAAAQNVETDPMQCWWRTSAGAIRVGDVFQMFVFGREAADVSEDSGIRRLVSSIAANVDGELDFTLKELLASSGGQRAARIA